MNGGVEFNGLVGVVVFLLTAALLAVIAVISLAAYIFGRRRGRNQMPVWPRYLGVPAATLLFLDVSIYLSVISSGAVTLTRDQAIELDNKMLVFWIPAHVVFYLLFIGVLYLVERRRENIDAFIQNLR